MTIRELMACSLHNSVKLRVWGSGTYLYHEVFQNYTLQSWDNYKSTCFHIFYSK